MRGNNANGTVEKPSEIDVGLVIDDSRLNRVSVSVILLCGLIMLMDGYDYTIITVAAPLIMKEWNVNTASFGWVFSAAFFGYLFGAIIFGTLSDKIGRKKTLILGACFFSVGTLLVYFSHSVSSLIPMRVFAGIGIGGQGAEDDQTQTAHRCLPGWPALRSAATASPPSAGAAACRPY